MVKFDSINNSLNVLNIKSVNNFEMFSFLFRSRHETNFIKEVVDTICGVPGLRKIGESSLLLSVQRI